MPAESHITSDSDLDGVLEEFNKRHKRRDSTGPKYHCSIPGCGASFKRLDQLDRHEYHHTGIKKHACTYEGCEKIYSILTHLKRHVRSTHERTAGRQKTIECTVAECKKMFTSSCNMQRHVREAHETPREYTCKYCSTKFFKKMKLRRHEIKQHTHEYPYRCDKCKRGFYQQWQHESHQRSCKIYACHDCHLEFDKWTLYTKHCRDTLHGRKMHKCEHCDRSYERAANLAKHITSEHSSTEDTKFSCTFDGCKRSYAYKRNLQKHVNTAHGGMRFQCTSCNRGFSSGQNLTKHYFRVHILSGTAKPLPTVTTEVNSTRIPTETTTASPVGSTTASPEKAAAKKPRKRRRDAGQPVRSHLAKMACVTLDKDVDKEVRQRKPLALKNASKQIEKQQKDDEEIEELMQSILESENKDLNELDPVK